MSNTLNTPVEALELAYPLRVERYALRLGSGGAGAHRGGDGVVRELRVLEDCRLSVIAERRAPRAAGERGGEDGAPGRTSSTARSCRPKVTRELARRRRRHDRDPGRRRARRVGSPSWVRWSPRSTSAPTRSFRNRSNGSRRMPVKGLAGNRYYWADGVDARRELAHADRRRGVRRVSPSECGIELDRAGRVAGTS